MKFRTLAACIISFKTILAIITPLGYDFVLYMSAVISADRALSWSPWIIFARSVYAFWLWLPIDHGDTLRAIAAVPDKLLSGHFLLTALVKSPLILSDIAIALMIYKLAVASSDSIPLARKATLLWLVNPFTTLLGEMWGGVDILIVALTLASIALCIRGKRVVASATLGSAIALRLSPIIVWPAIAIWSLRNKSNSKDMLALGLAGMLGTVGYFYWLSQSNAQTNFFWQAFQIYTPVTQNFSPYVIEELYSFLSLAVLATLGVYFLALETWRMDAWDLVSLFSAGLLSLYSMATWNPTAFLWVMPYVALWHSRHPGKYPYLLIFFALLAFSLFTFYNSELSSGGLSFLFIPLKFVPYGLQLVMALQSGNILRQFFLDVQIRSVLAGFTLAYAFLIAWRTSIGRHF